MKYLLLFLLLLPIAHASYIDAHIYLSPDGRATIDGTSDLSLEGFMHDGEKLKGTTERFSKKEGREWMFVLEEDAYERILLTLHLPHNVDKIYAMEGMPHALNIEEHTISLFGQNESLTFSVTYTLTPKKDVTSLWMGVTILFLLGIFFAGKKLRKKKYEHLHHILPILPEQEQLIVKTLMKRSMKQKALRKQLELPKASFSRYMAHLEEKGIILREGEGRNKLVKLKE